MGRKAKFSKEVKVQACEDYLSGKRSIAQIANDLSVYEMTIRTWVAIYNLNGTTVFNDKPRNQSYSKEFKLQVIQDYFNDGQSYLALAAKYNISKSMVFQWIKLYNSGKEIEDYDPKGVVYSMKSRHTTFEERLEIVKFVLDHEKEYKLAAEEYQLPYSLVYNWTSKYLVSGEDGLRYLKKGPKSKDYLPEDLSEKDKLIRENELLKRQLEYAKLENQVLKKKEQLERQAELQRLGRKKHTKR